MPRSRSFVDRAAGELRLGRKSQLVRYNLVPRNGAIISALSAPERQAVFNRTDRRLRASGDNPFVQQDDGSTTLPLNGLIAAVKDNFMTSNFAATCASNILHGFKSSTARAVKLLEKAGATIFAKTNMDEFGMGSHTTHSAFGPASNGHLSAGGSSGGSAMVVADNMVDFALGSDTGGSVRLPAAYTGVIGFKPSYGRVSRNGLIPYANSLDTVGVLARSPFIIEDVYKILDCPDAQDPTCLSRSSRARIQKALQERTSRVLGSPEGDQFAHDSKRNTHDQDPTRRYRIGVPVEYNIEELHPHVRKAWMSCLANLSYIGHMIVPISLPSTKQALSAYYVLAPAEASSNLAKYDGTRYGTPPASDLPDDTGGVLYARHRSQLFGDEVKRRILLGTFSLSAGAMDNYFLHAQKVRRLVQEDFNMVFRLRHALQDSSPAEDGVDFIVCPTAPTPPPSLSEVEVATAVETYMNDVFTVPASLAGLPAISVPYRLPDLPKTKEHAIGMQVIGQYGDDVKVIRFAGRYTADWWKETNQPRVGPRLRYK